MRHRVKSLLTALLMLALLLSMTLPALADGTITVTTVSGQRGEQVAVELRIAGSDVSAGNFDVTFDPAALELVGTKASSDPTAILSQREAGTVHVSFMSLTPVADGYLGTLIFRVTAQTDPTGTPVLVRQARLYNPEGARVGAAVVQGAVVRDCAWLSVVPAETAQFQTVRAEIDLGGTVKVAGGNFTLRYDPALLTPASVLPLQDGNFAYQILSPGLARVSFATAGVMEPTALCAVLFEAVGASGTASALTLSDVQLYGQDGQAVDAAVEQGEIQIVLPEDGDPKLWFVGGAVGEDGTATGSLVLQGRGFVYGGNVTVAYDPSMTVTAEAAPGCQIRQEPGKLVLSWASESAWPDKATLATLTFEAVVASAVTLSGASLYQQDGTRIPVAEVRPGAIGGAAVAAMVDEAQVTENKVSVQVDVADSHFFEEALDTVQPVLALYRDGRQVGLATAVVTMEQGIAELSLEATAAQPVTDWQVFLLEDDAYSPLCQALRRS